MTARDNAAIQQLNEIATPIAAPIAVPIAATPIAAPGQPPIVHTTSARVRMIEQKAEATVHACATARTSMNLPGVLLAVRGYVHFPGADHRTKSATGQNAKWIAWQGIGGSLCFESEAEAIEFGRTLRQFVNLVKLSGIDAVGNALDVLEQPGGAQLMEQVAIIVDNEQATGPLLAALIDMQEP